MDIIRPKIGLVGVMSTPFRGDKDGNFRNHRDELEKISNQLDFDFHPVEDGIYDASQAVSAVEELAEWGADFVILQASSFAAGDFVYPFVKQPWRLGIWAVPEGRPGPKGDLPLNSFTAANLYNSIIRKFLTDYHQPVKWFLGNPSDELFRIRLKVTVAALRPLLNLPGKKVALIGGVAPSFDNLIIDDSKLKNKLEVEVLHFDLEALLKIAKALDEAEIKKAAAAVRSSAAFIEDHQEQGLSKTARVITALEIMANEYAFDAVALSCWPQFQEDYNLAVCAVMGQINTGDLVAACEGDVTSAVSMLLMRYITNGDIVTLMDMASIDPTDESVLLWHCGPTAPSLADERGVRVQPLWLFDDPDGEQTGLHNDLVLRPGEASILGFTTDFEKMLILEGEIDNLKPSYTGSRGWFRDLRLNTAPVSTRELVQTIMLSGFQHHYPLGYGSLGNAALEYCSWAGVTPIQRKKYTHTVM